MDVLQAGGADWAPSAVSPAWGTHTCSCHSRSEHRCCPPTPDSAKATATMVAPWDREGQGVSREDRWLQSQGTAAPRGTTGPRVTVGGPALCVPPRDSSTRAPTGCSTGGSRFGSAGPPPPPSMCIVKHGSHQGACATLASVRGGGHEGHVTPQGATPLAPSWHPHVTHSCKQSPPQGYHPNGGALRTPWPCALAAQPVSPMSPHPRPCSPALAAAC